MPFLKSLRLDGLLSFPPGSEAIPLTPLNVLIGPNGSGKSNLIEAIELLHALPTGFAAAIRSGGGVREWLWKGEGASHSATIEAHIQGINFSRSTPGLADLYDPFAPNGLEYLISFTSANEAIEITTESVLAMEDALGLTERKYYSFDGGNPVISVLAMWAPAQSVRRDQRELDRRNFKPGESVLAQIKDLSSYPEITELGREFERISSFREWTFGPDSEIRKPQPTDLPSSVLLSDSRNLGLLLNRLEHSGAWSEFNGYLARFLPRFERYSTRIEGATVQFYLHEKGLKQPIPTTRLSDGTIRFMAILAQLLAPTPPPLICIEEPELGLHPDALSLLATLLQEASERTQLIVTTHSDALVSALTDVADSVLVCEYRNGTVMQRVDSSKLKFWLDKYKLGEIWRIGEIGGNL